MMKRFLIVLVLLGTTTAASAQIRYGLRTGLNYSFDPVNLDNASSLAQEALDSGITDNGYHIGLYGRQYLGDALYASASAFYGKNSNLLSVTDSVTNVTTTDLVSNQFFQIDAGLGIRILRLARVEGGVHYQGAITNLLSDNADDLFSEPSAGYNIGAGVDVGKLSLDITYYGSFESNTGMWNDIPLSYNTSQLLISIGARL